MRGVCAIEVDADKTFISFARLAGSSLGFLEESEIKLGSSRSGLAAFLKDNSHILEKEIKDKEKKYSMKVGRVFLTLPRQLTYRRIVEETVSWGRIKRITRKDLLSAKRHVEDVCLDWQDYCLHHLVLRYKAEGKVYYQPPLGVEAKKVTLTSLLIWIKESLEKEMEDFFFTLDKQFGGFVAEEISIPSAAFGNIDKQRRAAAVKIGYACSRSIMLGEGIFNYAGEYSFGLKNIVHSLEKRFLLPYSLAEEIFDRYISFKEVSLAGGEYPDREIRIKHGRGYLSLGAHSISSFVKNYIKNELSAIVKEVKNNSRDRSFSISFIGRLNLKEGFQSFIKEFAPYCIELNSHRCLSSSWGCLRYGIYRFWEKVSQERSPLLERVLKIYKEYF